MKNVDIAQWLKELPLAPEFRPTDTEFSDPIAYISKIEKEASSFGICKVIPPFSKPTKKYVLHNLNKSLSKCPELGSDVKIGSDKGNGECGKSRAVFTTRRQELGQSEKKKKMGAQKQVWQSGEIYTLEQFEAKSKTFARSQLGSVKDISPLLAEAMFWKAVQEDPLYVEYANDVPGSAFGEPEGVFNMYKTKRRRKKRASFDRNNQKTCDNKNKVGSLDSDSINLSTVTPSDCSTSSQPSLMPPVSESLRKDLHDSNNMEGTAGWKLSNSPWNLKVIARSPGSLTRYMRDDIPGVTCPMVYIGMLFSWFAWHVEDHELHSMNFLHMGSPKTWYAVPGDYASKFEEVVRIHAYGDSTDRLAALTLLGEKTTLLSPDIIASSGIPCCRLVQYPGEFVVTFPRAYHVGFSHGFNCGEAANFGTPQWLTVAKDAAIRRAAMNFLPMLSHQQLLYLLTMSFFSRVPKSLLPGMRSSRLKDRQKEERETSVKKAFVGDILKENKLVTILLQKNPSYQAVLWDVDMLPSSSKGFEMENCVGTDQAKRSSAQTENCNNGFEQMKSYMENLSDFYEEDDDLSNYFQVDTGALPCIACGILGFPFMAIVQPSVKSAKSFSSDDFQMKQCIGDSEESNFEDKCDVGIKFPRPRILCIEHAIQTEELLQTRGGAEVLVTCHSDFQKIRAYASFIAEQTDTSFVYNEIPLSSASKEHLQLIDLAIEYGNSECVAEDWTSTLHINLLHSVKSCRNNSPAAYALVLSRLFPNETFSSNCFGYKWESRKVRSKRKMKPCTSKEKMTVQYTRKRFKLKPKGVTENLISETLTKKDQNGKNSSGVTMFVRSPCEGLRPRVTKKETSGWSTGKNSSEKKGSPYRFVSDFSRHRGKSGHLIC